MSKVGAEENEPIWRRVALRSSGPKDKEESDLLLSLSLSLSRPISLSGGVLLLLLHQKLSLIPPNSHTLEILPAIASLRTARAMTERYSQGNKIRRRRRATAANKSSRQDGGTVIHTLSLRWRLYQRLNSSAGGARLVSTATLHALSLLSHELELCRSVASGATVGAFRVRARFTSTSKVAAKPKPVRGSARYTRKSECDNLSELW